MGKCEHGYIKHEKTKKLLIILLYIVLGVAIFLTGYFLNHHSKSNVFTVVAILLVLPAAKHAVALIILAPFHTISDEKHQQMCEHFQKEDTVITDYVFTSPEKVMGITYLVLSDGNALGYVANEKQELNYINTYLGKGIHQLSPEYHVKIVATEEDFLRLYQKKTAVSVTEKQKEAVEAWLRSLAV